ncbi:MAG: RluA family pseudouridine synthase [Candidatus Dormibacteria bacterium]
MSLQVEPGPPVRLDAFLARESGGRLSRTAAQRLIREGLVQVNGQPARPSLELRGGESVQYQELPPVTSTLLSEALPVHIVHEDEFLAVIDKQAGMVVHPAPGHPTGTLVNALLGRGSGWSGVGGVERPGIVHRLDRWTSGLLVVARDDRTHRDLARQLSERTMSRTYIAICDGVPTTRAAIIDAPIGRDPRNRQRMAVVDDGRPARTRYDTIEEFSGHALLRLSLETGRTHQVRVHLASIEHPVTGDTVYGRASDLIGRTALHAAHLRFRHPASGEEVEYDAPLPADMVAALHGLREPA